MQSYPLRLGPGSDLKAELDQLVLTEKWSAACIVSGIGSLSSAAIRFASQSEPEILAGPLEIVSLAGTLSPDGSHIHILVSDAEGSARGGHLKEGSVIRTTAEIVLGILPEWEFARITDPETGFPELKIERKPSLDFPWGRVPEVAGGWRHQHAIGCPGSFPVFEKVLRPREKTRVLSETGFRPRLSDRSIRAKSPKPSQRRRLLFQTRKHHPISHSPFATHSR